MNFADVRIVAKHWLVGVYGPEAILKRRYIPPALILARRISISKWPIGGWRASYAIPNQEVMKRNSSTVKVSFPALYLFIYLTFISLASIHHTPHGSLLFLNKEIFKKLISFHSHFHAFSVFIFFPFDLLFSNQYL